MDLILDDNLHPELRRILEEHREVVAATIRPCVKFTLQPQPTLDVWRSKVGGVPYLPKNIDYPRSPTGRELQFLAQINFAEVPRLPKFPDKGIVQFYIGDDDLYGLQKRFRKGDDAYKVLYHPNFTRDPEFLVSDFSFLPEFEYSPLSHRSAPAALHFEKKYLPVPENLDIPWELSEAFEELRVSSQAYLECLSDYAMKVSQESGHKIGGYPALIQDRGWDGRHNHLLLQLDTDYVKNENNDYVNLMWGDAGIGRFYISDADLMNLNFSNVTYDWDCA